MPQQRHTAPGARRELEGPAEAHRRGARPPSFGKSITGPSPGKASAHPPQPREGQEAGHCEVHRRLSWER